MDKEQEYDLIARAQAGDSDAEAALLVQFNDFCWKSALKRCPLGEDVEDFVQMAAMYLLQAIRRFDFSKNVRLLTYAYQCVPMQLLRDAKTAGIIHVPPNAEGFDTFESRSRFKYLEGFTYGIESSGKLDSRDADSAEEKEQYARLHAAIAQLDEREQIVIIGRMSGKILDEIGEIIGVTRERVRQIETKAHNRLRIMLTEGAAA